MLNGTRWPNDRSTLRPRDDPKKLGRGWVMHGGQHRKTLFGAYAASWSAMQFPGDTHHSYMVHT